MRALLKPKVQRPGVEPHVVEMMARTGNDKIVVQGVNSGAPVHSVDRWRLYDAHQYTRRIGDDEFARLPWRGKGKDPLTLSTGKLFADLEERP